MSAKPLFAATLLLTAFGFGVARGQNPAATTGATPLETGTVPGGLIGERQPGMPGSLPPSPETEKPPPPLPAYVTYNQPGCCGPLGGDGPILEEVYARVGPSWPIGGHIFGHTLEVGWEIVGGGRSLFYNPAQDAAWVVDLSLSNTRNQGQHSDIHIPLSILALNAAGTPTRINFGTDPGVPGVTIKDLNRTAFNFGLGREWYLIGTACSPGKRWRAGFDVGGLWGSQRAEFNEIRHRTSVIDGGWVAAHTDLECPCCSVVFLFGFRAEWVYTHSTILQGQNDGNVQDINFLFTTGVRF